MSRAIEAVEPIKVWQCIGCGTSPRGEAWEASYRALQDAARRAL